DHGNRLVEIGSTEVPIVIVGELPPVVAAPAPSASPVTASPPAAAPAPSESPPVAVEVAPRPIYLRWWPYAAAPVVAGSVSAYFGWKASSDVQELYKRADTGDAESQAIADRGTRRTWIFNIGIGVTGACAIAAGVMYVAGRRTHADTRLTAVPLPAG